jgi:hypothetical protein
MPMVTELHQEAGQQQLTSPWVDTLPYTGQQEVHQRVPPVLFPVNASAQGNTTIEDMLDLPEELTQFPDDAREMQGFTGVGDGGQYEPGWLDFDAERERCFRLCKSDGGHYTPTQGQAPLQVQQHVQSLAL